jgi:hypothetical protein
MGELGEILPVIGGMVVGGVALRIGNARWRWAFIAIGSVVAGALASWVNGELEISLGFLLVDVPLALVGAGVVLYIGARVRSPARGRPKPG